MANEKCIKKNLVVRNIKIPLKKKQFRAFELEPEHSNGAAQTKTTKLTIIHSLLSNNKQGMGLPSVTDETRFWVGPVSTIALPAYQFVCQGSSVNLGTGPNFIKYVSSRFVLMEHQA